MTQTSTIDSLPKQTKNHQHHVDDPRHPPPRRLGSRQPDLDFVKMEARGAQRHGLPDHQPRAESRVARFVQPPTVRELS